MVQDIARVYQQCDPARPLQAGDPRYMPLTGVRGPGDLVTRLANAIRRSDSPVHLLFAGHRGGGKSTELLRLKHELSNPPEVAGGFFVVYFEADDEDVDVNDIDFPDLLLAIIRQVGMALRQRVQEELRPRWLNRFLDEARSLLGNEVEFQKLELDAKIAKFTAAIKSSPEARREIRKVLEPNVSNLIQAANDLLLDAVTRLRSKGFRDLVLIVDNLDCIVLRDIPDSPFNTHEQLFINRGTQLAQLRSHVVYTLPISMVFSPRATALVTVFNRRPDVLPMVRVIERGGTDCLAGMEAMRDVVSKRLQAAGVQQERAFDSVETLNYLCRMSGGHIRNLLILLRSSCDWLADLPVTRDAFEQSVRGMSNDFERALYVPALFDVLRQVDQSH